jgi:hypothetical protein
MNIAKQRDFLLKEVKVLPPGSQKLDRKKMIQAMWEYDDGLFWGAGGFNRDNLEGFSASLNNYRVIANYFDIVGDISEIDPLKKVFLDGTDVTKDFRYYLKISRQD